MSEPNPIYETASNTGVPETAAPLTCQVCGDELRFGAMHVCRGVCEYSPGVSAPVNGMVYWKTSCGMMLDRTADEPPSSTLVDWPYVARHRNCPFCGKSIKVVT